jgi:hypothetical protein
MTFHCSSVAHEVQNSEIAASWIINFIVNFINLKIKRSLSIATYLIKLSKPADRTFSVEIFRFLNLELDTVNRKKIVKH